LIRCGRFPEPAGHPLSRLFGSHRLLRLRAARRCIQRLLPGNTPGCSRTEASARRLGPGPGLVGRLSCSVYRPMAVRSAAAAHQLSSRRRPRWIVHAMRQCCTLHATGRACTACTWQPPFLNTVVKALTTVAPLELLRLLKAAEARLGRDLENGRRCASTSRHGPWHAADDMVRVACCHGTQTTHRDAGRTTAERLFGL
jgi:hypothetical protein